jgi:hypothetical protein
LKFKMISTLPAEECAYKLLKSEGSCSSDPSMIIDAKVYGEKAAFLFTLGMTPRVYGYKTLVMEGEIFEENGKTMLTGIVYPHLGSYLISILAFFSLICNALTASGSISTFTLFFVMAIIILVSVLLYGNIRRFIACIRKLVCE